MKKPIRFVWIVLALCFSCRGQAESSDLWLQDFEILQSELARGYANLEWSADFHDLDLAALSRETEDQLSRARSAGKARKIIEAFLETFGDPHLKAKHQSEAPAPPPTKAAWEGPAAHASAKDAMKSLGYRKSKSGFDLPFKKLVGFRELESQENPFPAGILELDDGRRVGVLRIKYFGEDRYYETAAAIWPEFSKQIEGVCRSDCWWTFTRRVRKRLLGNLHERIQQLESAGAQALLVDITGNGGGSEWCEDVAQMFHPTTLEALGVGMVKHAHWVRALERELRWLNTDLARSDLSDDMRRILGNSRKEHDRLLREVKAGCDPATTWRPEVKSVPCRRVIEDRHGTFDIPSDERPVVDSLLSKSLLFRFPQAPEFMGVYSGRLFVVIDGGTASASEQFATLLQYNQSATIVGEKSYGAGCGYTNGGIRLYLENVQLRVWMPDCMRYRADGQNERAGVMPDVAGWAKGSKGKQRVHSLAAVLASHSDW